MSTENNNVNNSETKNFQFKKVYFDKAGKTIDLPYIQNEKVLQLEPYDLLKDLTHIAPEKDFENGGYCTYSGIFKAEWLIPWNHAQEVTHSAFHWLYNNKARVESITEEGVLVSAEVVGSCNINTDDDDSYECVTPYLYAEAKNVDVNDYLRGGVHQYWVSRTPEAEDCKNWGWEKAQHHDGIDEDCTLVLLPITTASNPYDHDFTRSPFVVDIEYKLYELNSEVGKKFQKIPLIESGELKDSWDVVAARIVHPVTNEEYLLAFFPHDD